MPLTDAQRRVVAYDALRVFAIVTVVGIHTLMPYRDLLPPTAAIRVFDDLLHYAVPLFVFISGALIWSRPWHGGRGAYRRFITRRAALIGMPYLAWSAFFLALAWLDEGVSASSLPGMLLTGTWYHLYFVPMLLAYYLLTPLASRVAGRSPEALVLAAYALRIVPDPPLATLAGDLLGPAAWSFATHVITHLPHMALGAWFAIRYPSWPEGVKKLWPVLLAAGTVVLAAASYDAYAGWPLYARRLVYPGGMALTVLGFALLAFWAEPWLERFSAGIARGSALAFGVYFVHPAFLLGVTVLVAATAGPAAWLRPWLPVVTFAAVTAASFGVAHALAQRPSTAWLVGLRRPSRDT